jgi:hypothetical protein
MRSIPARLIFSGGHLFEAIQKADIDATCSGRDSGLGQGIQAIQEERATLWPELMVD